MTKVNETLLGVARLKSRAYALLDAYPWKDEGYKDQFEFLRVLYGSQLTDSQLLNLFVEQYDEWEASWEVS